MDGQMRILETLYPTRPARLGWSMRLLLLFPGRSGRPDKSRTFLCAIPSLPLSCCSCAAIFALFAVSFRLCAPYVLLVLNTSTAPVY